MTDLLRMSSLFLRTLREDPADAEVPSHRLLVRAGYVRRVAPGIFSWLPLGYRVLRNVERIVRAEMDDMGAQEVHFPALLPREPYEATGRWTEYGEGIFRLKDRRDNDFLLGPTHEEMFTLMVKDLYSSYRDLPLSLYQIQTKYRDEARPRAGILRGREFVMKDSYSFDVDDAGLATSYAKHRAAYIKTFDRLGLEYVIVSATSGAMGGSASEEFLAACETGEDTYVRCVSCDFAANVEAVTTPAPDPAPAADVRGAHKEDTPDAPTIEALVAVSNTLPHLVRTDRAWVATDTLKMLLFAVVAPGGGRELLAIGLPGDREVDMKRLEAQVYPAVVAPATDADFAAHPEFVKGYLGPAVVGTASASGVRFLVDPRVAPGTSWIAGGNVHGKHDYDLVYSRDFTADGTVEAAEVRAGDSCPNCGAALEIARGIEVGHIFSLGRKFAKALDLTVLNENGEQIVVTMGSYGIGVSRLVAAIAEQSHDDRGLIWPAAVSPADVHIVATGKDDAPFEAAEALAAELVAGGVRVLLDDRRGVSPGVKFNDSELVGVPTIVVVGKRLVDGIVEVKDRRTGERSDVDLSQAAAYLFAAK